MLEQAYWIAGILSVILAIPAIKWVRKKVSNRAKTSQNAKVLGSNNTVNQTTNVGTDK